MLWYKTHQQSWFYFHGHSLGLLAEPGNKLPVIRINFITVMLVEFFLFCMCWFQKLLCKNGQENTKWFKFSHSNAGRSSHLTYIKYSLDQLLPVIYSVKPTRPTLKKIKRTIHIPNAGTYNFLCIHKNSLQLPLQEHRKKKKKKVKIFLTDTETLKMKISQPEIEENHCPWKCSKTV